MFYLRNLGGSIVVVIMSLVAMMMALFIAIPFHEFAHAYVAKKEGDYTAVAYKRCTPAALAHFDFYGFFMMFLFGFGWAKPVPINSNNFKRGRKSQFLVSIAGIVMNLIIGVLSLFIYMLIFKIDSQFFYNSIYGNLLSSFLRYSYSLNFGLAFFNLLPIYPFDGYNIIDSLCRYDNAYLRFAKKYSTIILFVILLTGIYSVVYSYIVGNLMDALYLLFSKILGL